MRLRLLPCLTLCVCGVLSSDTPLHAGIVTHTFSGKIDSITTMGTGSVPFAVGTSFTGSYSYESSTSLSSTVGAFSVYDIAHVSIQFIVAGTYDYSRSYTAPVYSSPQDFVETSVTQSSPPNTFLAQLSSSSVINGSQVADGEYVRLDGASGMLSSANLATLTVNPSLLTDARVVFQQYVYTNPNFTSFVNFQGKFDTFDGIPLGATPAPEPATLSMACLGVTVFALTRRQPHRRARA